MSTIAQLAAWEAMTAAYDNVVAERNALNDDLAHAKRALRDARDAMVSPTRPYSRGQDIYDTKMMMRAILQADAVLDEEWSK